MHKLILSLGILTSPLLMADDSNPRNSMDDYQEQNFLQTLQAQIQKQQDLVNQLKAQIERTDIIAPGAINNQFENAYTMLNVKKTLYSNFVGTPSIKSPLVQQKLLQIFAKDLITPGDLSELEALVQQERPKYINKPAPTGQ